MCIHGPFAIGNAGDVQFHISGQVVVQDQELSYACMMETRARPFYVYVFMYVWYCMVCMYACMYVYTYVICELTYIYICVCIHMYYMCICVYIYI